LSLVKKTRKIDKGQQLTLRQHCLKIKGQAEDEVVKEAGISNRTKPVKHICVYEQRRGCPHHDTAPTPDDKDLIIHWCGPWREQGGTRWLNIAELIACPKGKWGDVSKNRKIEEWHYR